MEHATPADGPASEIAAIIVGLDASLQRASRTYDGDTIRSLISRDFTLVTSSGREMNAADFIADVEDSSVTWHENLTENATVRAYNDDCAVITADLHSVFDVNGVHHDVRIRFTDTWVKSEGSWRYVAGHASRLTPAPKS
ncbi:MAG: nuclear transport factor 2 family protein [Candidatus Eremiobacteraeota bacterium]|nr:nuclear transport factor 2 family protein [Candidatus Eremiobacteraeota bacterium]MDQ2864797.1 nuclear transport factor 2 family protein [Candidatus Eremiobacteraeota bacterium]